MEEGISCKWESKESWDNNNDIQNRLLKKNYNKRPRRTLHNNQGINLKRR